MVDIRMAMKHEKVCIDLPQRRSMVRVAPRRTMRMVETPLRVWAMSKTLVTVRQIDLRADDGEGGGCEASVSGGRS